MATPTTIKFAVHPPTAFIGTSIQQEAADKASEVLQRNHDDHDFIFTNWGAHNHTVHHISTIFALGATADQLQARFDQDAAEQRPPPPEDREVIETLHDREIFHRLLGTKTTLYASFLRFFTTEIEQKGWQRVCNEYVFGHDKLGNTLLRRLSASFGHPVIHLGFGIEFEQPALVAEGLAQTACHPNWDDGLWFETEKHLRDHESAKKPLIDIIHEIRADKKLSTAADWDMGQKIRDGLLVRARDGLITEVASWQIDANDDLEEATAQMISTFAYYTGAAQRKDKQINFDFYFMHMANSTIFFSSFLQQDWISRQDKARILTSHGRYGIAIYASRRSPELHGDEMISYKPKVPGDWRSLFVRACVYEDDGHAAKLVRALANGEKRCRPYEGKPNFPMRAAMWLQLAHMVMDAVEVLGHSWIRSAGFDEAWKDIPARTGQVQ